MGASRLSYCPTLLYLEHQAEERRLMSWSIMEENNKKKIIAQIVFLRQVIPEGERRSHTEGGKKAFF